LAYWAIIEVDREGMGYSRKAEFRLGKYKRKHSDQLRKPGEPQMVISE